MTVWHTLDIPETLARLGVNPATGLSAVEAARRLKQHGANELRESNRRSPWRILWEQLTATMVLILIAAGLISAFLQKWHEAAAIFAIVVLFTLLGFVQEYRAERAMAALKKLAVPAVRVRRDGQLLTLSARELIPGDVVLLEAGNIIAADMRLIESVNLRIQESALTGESEAVEKSAATRTPADAPLGDRRCMAYMGTTVTYGRGAGVVVANGMNTELGHIASLLQAAPEEQTPLQKRLDHVGKTLAAVGVVIAAIIGALELMRPVPVPPGEVLLTAVSVAVAIVPEGLPAVVTITLAIGAQRMLNRQALIRKLPAVETLGSVTVICSDKTGTLTENRMTVTLLDVAGSRVDLDETSTRGGSSISLERSTQLPADVATAIKLLLTVGSLCNDSTLQLAADGNTASATGDPTENAIVIAAAHFGIFKTTLDQSLPRVAELPFDSDRKRMTTAHTIGNGASHLPAPFVQLPYLIATKGSVDGLSAVCTHVWADDQSHPLTARWQERIDAANMQLAQNGMRVLGVAVRGSHSPEPQESDLIFIGMVGIIDPPRPEVQQAVAISKSAGIRPVMITGDHPLTAAHIARQLGIAAAADTALTGQEVNAMSDEALRRAVENYPVFARVSPAHKLRIVEALQKNGHIVAMTGDGVNDAPALKRANIGVAMGITGTDVSKEAADMVLRDDNFATIVAAVEEGRVIFDNIRKFVKFSVAGNFGKVMVMLAAPLLGMPIAVLPLQLLWLNLLTDGLLGVGLGVEPAEAGIMNRQPHTPGENIFNRKTSLHIARTGFVLGLVSLAMGYWHWSTGHDDWQTMIFSTLAFTQMWQALAVRSGNQSLFAAGIMSNKPLLGLVALTFSLQLAAIFAPPLQSFLRTSALTPADMLLTMGVSSLVFVAIEIEKYFERRNPR